MEERYCDYCEGPIPSDKQRSAIFCSDNCRKYSYEANFVNRVPEKNCTNCVKGLNTGNKEYGFNGFLCGAETMLSCKPGIHIVPKYWEENIGQKVKVCS